MPIPSYASHLPYFGLLRAGPSGGPPGATAWGFPFFLALSSTQWPPEGPRRDTPAGLTTESRILLDVNSCPALWAFLQRTLTYFRVERFSYV